MTDMTISIAPEQVDEIQAELDSWCNRAKMSHKQLESLIGKLLFTSQVIRMGQMFLAHLLDELRGSPKWGYIAVPVSIMQDVKWWQYIMPILNGTKSWKNLSHHIKTYRSFANHFQFLLLPLQTTCVCLFAAHLAVQGKSHATTRNYLNSLSTYGQLWGYPPLNLQNVFICLTLQGIL